MTITGPVGTNFSTLTPGGLQTMNNNTTDPGSSSSINALSVTNGGRTITVEVPSINVAVGQELRISLSVAQNVITFGTVSGDSSFQVTTNKDTTPAATPPYTTAPAAPTQVVVVDGSQRTPHDQLFDLLTVAVRDQFGNDVAGQPVTATAPGSGASGTFTGGVTTASVTTGIDGTVALPRITANSTIGDWTLALASNALTGSNSMNNLAYGDPADIALTLAPPSITADGTSKSQATATVTDQFGNKIPDESVTITSNGSQQIGAVTNVGDGTYNAEITASSVAGQSVITATDNDARNPTGTATLTQTARPATTAELTLSPTSIKADGTSTTTATVKLSDAVDGPVSGDNVTITSTGTQNIGAVTDKGNGTYTATITSSKTAGDSSIKATDTSVVPELSSAATLTQTAVPVSPTVIKPVLKFLHPPKKKVKSAKVTFKFKVIKGKAKSFQCKLDGKKWAKCKSPKKVKVKKGKHVFKVRGIATDGSFGKAITRKIKRVS